MSAMKLTSLNDLLIEELRDLYSAENQLVKALPKMAKAASSEELGTAFREHLDLTKGHVERLKTIFEGLDAKPTGRQCPAMKGLVEEGVEAIEAQGEDSVRDAALVVAAQKVEHYEISGYRSACSLAELLGKDDAAEVLQEILDEEEDADRKYGEIAEDVIKPEAAAMMQEAEEEEEE